MAQAWFTETFGPARTERVAAFLSLVIAENDRQNLIAPSTVPDIWERHARDAAQLLRYDQPGLWIDIGTGGGFPGIIVAILRDDPMLLVEPRRRRADFLSACVQTLDLASTEVQQTKIEQVTAKASVISARAVASVSGLLAAAAKCSSRQTRWVLPKGRNHADDLAEARRQWHGVFHVEQSLTDPASAILILEQVGPK